MKVRKTSLMTTKQKQAKLIDILTYTVLLIIISAVMLTLFYRQTTGGETGYWSDMEAYILEMLGVGSKYSFPYPVLFRFAAFLHLFTTPEMAVALATMILNALSMVIIKLAFQYLLGKEMEAALPKCKWLAGILISILSLSLFYISMVYPPQGIYLPGIKHTYLGVFTPNPFHNATYLAARPFALLAFFWYAKLLPVYEQGYGGKWKNPISGVSLRDYVLFSLFLLLSTMTKPSFTLVICGAAGILMVYRIIRSGFRNFLPTIQLGCCFIPTFINLLYQYSGVFVPEPGEEGGIGFGLATAWKHYCDNIPLAVGLAAGFPILVLLLNYKELKKDMIYRFSWQIFGMSLLMLLFMHEKGFRLLDLNFSWGYMYGIFFVFVGSLIVLIRTTATKAKHVGLLILEWLAYGWHLLCGILYFANIFAGNLYY